jgi:hypothetical protein
VIHLSLPARSAALLACLLLPAVPAFAAVETYVSEGGRDGAPCTQRRPCRTIGRAYAVTDPGGTLTILDTGTFLEEAMFLTKSISIVAVPGSVAVMAPDSGGAFFVGGTGVVVVLRGLTFRGNPTTPLNGVIYNSGQALHVENCVFTDFPTKGILSLSHGQLFVKDSVFRNNSIGISLDAPTVASIDRVRLEYNEYGLVSGLGAKAVVRDSLAAGNSEVGFLADSFDPAGAAELTLEDCGASNNGVGIESRSFDTKTIVRASGCQVVGNGTGLRRTGAADFESRGNNTVRGNGLDVDGTIAVFAPQ